MKSVILNSCQFPIILTPSKTTIQSSFVIAIKKSVNRRSISINSPPIIMPSFMLTRDLVLTKHKSSPFRFKDESGNSNLIFPAMATLKPCGSIPSMMKQRCISLRFKWSLRMKALSQLLPSRPALVIETEKKLFSAAQTPR